MGLNLDERSSNLARLLPRGPVKWATAEDKNQGNWVIENARKWGCKNIVVMFFKRLKTSTPTPSQKKRQGYHQKHNKYFAVQKWNANLRLGRGFSLGWSPCLRVRSLKSLGKATHCKSGCSRTQLWILHQDPQQSCLCSGMCVWFPQYTYGEGTPRSSHKTQIMDLEGKAWDSMLNRTERERKQKHKPTFYSQLA